MLLGKFGCGSEPACILVIVAYEELYWNTYKIPKGLEMLRTLKLFSLRLVKPCDCYGFSSALVNRRLCRYMHLESVT